jgi:hypothetical protein
MGRGRELDGTYSMVTTEGSRPDPIWHRADRWGAEPVCHAAIQLRYMRSVEGEPPAGARRCRKCWPA